MKRLFAVALTTIFALPILTTAYVFAHAEDSSDDTTTTNSSETEDSEKSDQELESRLEKHKTQFEVHLTRAEMLRVELKCVGGQGLISKVKGRVKGIETSRTQVYGNLVDHLDDLVTKLKAAGVDTTELEADIATLKTKITTFNTDLAAYKQALSDLVEVNCKEDPEGFQASLEAARAALTKVKTDAGEVRNYLTGTIKPLLVQIRSQVDTKKEDNEGEN